MGVRVPPGAYNKMKKQKTKTQKFLIKKFSFKVFLFLLVFLLLPLSAETGACDKPLVPCGPGTSKNDCEFCDLFVLFDNIVDFLLICIVPPVAVLMIAIGGFMYFFAFLNPGSEGQPALLSKARSLFSTVIWGLLIIFSAWIIVSAFFQIIGVAEWTGLKQEWWIIKDCP